MVDHHPCLVAISLFKIANLSQCISRLSLIITGSYFIILGLEVQGVKAVWVDTGSRAVLPTILRTQNQSPCQSWGLRFVGWVQSLGGVKCLGTSLMLWMQSEIVDLLILFFCFWKKKTQHDSLKTSGLCPLGYCLKMVVVHLAVQALSLP